MHLITQDVEFSLCFATPQLCDLKLPHSLCWRGRAKYLINIIAIIIREFGGTGFSNSPRMNSFFFFLWIVGIWKTTKGNLKEETNVGKNVCPFFLSPLHRIRHLFPQKFPLVCTAARIISFLNRPTWVVTQTPSPATWVVWGVSSESQSSHPHL